MHEEKKAQRNSCKTFEINATGDRTTGNERLFGLGIVLDRTRPSSLLVSRGEP